ncbi:hypothetical protein AA313_de0202375 [Arthrobotrys entomopaga]|nr:hypothetical protein AA313_de0202375 [Arthrobotrys entomopaga]
MMNRSYLAIGRAMRLQLLRRTIPAVSKPQLKPFTGVSKTIATSTPIFPRIPLRAFSSGIALSRPSGTVDEELSAKLQNEINVETELGEEDQMPGNLQEFLDNSQFKHAENPQLKDKPGMEEVELVRRFGDETVRVIFSIADLNTLDDKVDDPSLYDQEEMNEPLEEDMPSKRASGSDPNSVATPEEDEQEYDEAVEPAYPARLNITIEKSTSGALQVEAVAQDGMIIVENVHYHPSVELATAQTAEADWERRGRYVGPPFGNLDEDLQVLLEKYLDERGINTALALFVPDYIDYKEQKEYISWLKNMKSFVQA